MKNLSKTQGRCIALLFLMLIITAPTQAQFFTEDFEAPAATYTISQVECNDNNKDYFTRTDGSDIGGVYNMADGTFFAAMDIDGAPCTMNSSTMSFDDIDIIGKVNIVFCIDLAEDDDGSNQDWDLGDFLHIDYDVDNSGSFTPLLWVESDPSTATGGSSSNGIPFIDTDFDGNGDGAEITDDFTQHCVWIPVTGSTLDIEFLFRLGAGEEDIAIDNITLCEGGVEFTNDDLTEAVNVFSVDATGFQTWLGVEIAAGDSWTGCASEGEMFIFRDVVQNSQLLEYTFGPAACDPVIELIPPFAPFGLPCDVNTGGFQSYPVATGVNKKDFTRTTMYNGPFNNETFEDHIGDMIGVYGNYVYLADPATNQVSTYVLSTGKWITTYTATAFTGGSAAGPIASANIVGVANTFRANVLGADGSIDTYSLIDGSLLQDNPQTVFKTGPLDGTTFASANIIGCARNINVITILEADGTLVEYTIRGVYYGNDFSAANLSGGQMDGSTFTAEAGRIVGINGVGDVLMVSECSVTPSAPQRIDNGSAAIITQPSSSLEKVTFSAFPNPLNNSNVLTLNVKNLDTPIQSTVTIMDVTGKVWNVKEIDHLQNGNFEINMTNLPQGLYFLNVRSGDTLKTLKVVK